MLVIKLLLVVSDIINPHDEGDAHNWYCLSYQFEDGYGLSRDSHVWLNPHEIYWNHGMGIQAEGCDSRPTTFPTPTSTSDTDQVIRGMHMRYLADLTYS